ncbi:MAG: lectin like domain-containing protein [Armatimonadota bacterium]
MKVNQLLRGRLSIMLIPAVLTLCLPMSVLAQERQPTLAPMNPEFTKYLQGLGGGIGTQLLDSSGQSFGEIPSPRDDSYLKGKRIFGNRARVMDALPSTYDLRDQNKLTSVKNQGSCGSCWAFAAMGCLESGLMPGETWDFSENNLKNLHGLDWGCCDGGNPYLSSAYFARWDGPVKESDDTYKNSCTSSKRNAQKHVQDIIMIPRRADSLDNDNIKQAVMTYGAVLVSYFHDDSYYNSAHKSYYFNKEDWGTNHEVCVVGWDDSFPRTYFKTGVQPPGDGAFIIKNSWGTGWGESGYFYISYYDTTLSMYMAGFVFKVEAADNYATIYQYDTLGWVTSSTLGSDSAWFANVFVASDNVPLTAVGWYTAMPGSPYEIYIYKNPTSGPTGQGDLVATKTGTIPNPGYATTQLDVPVSLTKGQKFSVVVKLTTPDYNWPVPIEYPWDGYSSAATANPGESYTSNDGTAWTDMTDVYENTNVCLKAYAGNPELAPPDLEITSPTIQSTYYTHAATIDVSGIASDNRSVQSITWQNTTLDTGPHACENGGDWATWVARGIPVKPESSNDVVITALDGDGNETTASLTVINDNTNPTVSITGPTSENYYYPAVTTLSISGSASDKLGVSGVIWSNSGTGASGTCACTANGGTTSWNASGITLAVGGNTNVITVTAADIAGNTSTDTLGVIPMAGIRTVPSKVGLVKGALQHFKIFAIGLDGADTALPDEATATWSATTGEITQTGEFTAGSDPSVVTVSAAGKTATVDVELIAANVVSGYALERWWGGNFDKPIGVSISPGGSVFLADSGNDRIQKYDSRGCYDEQFAGIGEHPFDTPRNLAVDSEGNLYISDTKNNRIQKYNSDWELITEWGALGTGDGKFTSPHGIAIDRNDNVYVADSGNNRIQKFDSDGQYLAQLATSVSAGIELAWPRDVAVVYDASASKQYLYVADTHNNAVKKFVEKSNGSLAAALTGSSIGRSKLGVIVHASSQSISYEQVATWGNKGSKDGEFLSPTGIMADASGNLYVSDYFNNRIQKFDSTGKFLGKWGTQGTSGGEFNQPVGIRPDADGNIYVVDTYNDRVQKFVPNEDMSVTITVPTAESTYRAQAAKVSLSGTATGLVVGVGWANSSTGDSGQCAGCKQWSAADVPLKLGQNTILVTARGFYGTEIAATLIVYYTLENDSVTVSIPTITPSTVESEGTAVVSASGVDSMGHVLTYTWSDGGKGGQFANMHAASTTYSAPANTQINDSVVTITCLAECGASSGNASAQLLVMGKHEVTLTKVPTLDKSTVDPGKDVKCSVTAADTKDHPLLYQWSDGGAGGTFSPSSSVQDPTYTAPGNITGKAKSVVLTCVAKCSQSPTTKATSAVTLTVNDPAPSIAITGPTSDDKTDRTGSTLRISGTTSADTTKITWINGANGESGSVTGATSWEIDDIGIDVGMNLITVTASDAGGGKTVDTIEVTRKAASVADVWQGIAMVALPIIPDEADPKNVVHFFDVGWTSYKTQNNYYVAYATDTSHYSWFDPASSTPGRGFWAHFGGTVETPCGKVPEQDQPVEIHLYKGWNLIGQPFLGVVNWNTTAITVRSLSGGVTALKDAGSYVQNYAWGWQPSVGSLSKGEYYLVADPYVIAGATGQLAPWRAYWVRALQECYLIIPAPAQ